MQFILGIFVLPFIFFNMFLEWLGFENGPVDASTVIIVLLLILAFK